MRNVGHRWRWSLTLLWMLLIFFLSAQSGSGVQSSWLLHALFAALGVSVPPEWLLGVLHTALRKAAHVFEFGVLALLMAWSLMPRTGYLVKAWVFTVAYATSDELHQLVVPHRAGTLLDVAIDATGASLALLLLVWRLNRQPARVV